MRTKRAMAPQDDMSEDTIDTESISYVCACKLADFRLLGYTDIDEETLWAFVSDRYDAMPMPHVVVSDILAVQPPQLLHWLMMRSWKQGV
ncbi:MAG: hypothetical protein KGO83_05125 [Paenibacillaceae bacterium]|jgi:hypothetical protein|nr:hypothetical protein [Paenibacillaceae bacterium]